MPAIQSYLLVHRRIALAIAACFSLLLGLAVSEGYRFLVEREYRTTLRSMSQREALALQSWTLTGKGMGAVALGGQLDVPVKQAALETDVEQAKLKNIARPALKIIANGVGANHAFVANIQGIITSDWDSENLSPVGLNISFRPYFVQAMRGVESVFGGISSTTKKRVFYVAAPIYREQGIAGEISGVIAARFYADAMDRFLEIDPEMIGLVISPDGVVFASNHPDLVMHLQGPADPARIRAIHQRKQYGKLFENPAAVHILPFDTHAAITEVGDKRHAVARAEVNWNDPGGQWQVVLLGNLETLVPLSQRLVLWLTSSFLAFLLCWMQLRRLADESVRQKQQQEILQQAKAVQQANQAKRDFLANMSHEIRTPMNAIIGMSHLALQTMLNPRQRSYIERVHTSATSLLGLINDILDFSKIEAGKLALEHVSFQLEEIFENLSNLIGLKASDKGLELLFDIPPELPTALVGDPLRLSQILINLGNNAAKFTERGEIVIGVEVVSATPESVRFHFWVRDSGIGIALEQQVQLFQSFTQADTSTTRKYGGSGLGLAISRQLVEMMQGRIWVASVPGQGATFHFEVLLGRQERAAACPLDTEALQDVRVLVVDDNDSAREILQTAAMALGLHVDTAINGQDALEKVASAVQAGQPYNLILMDWHMPEMDGIDCVRQLQSGYAETTPAVIMVTAYGREDALYAAEQQGVRLNSVLTKPVTPGLLLETVNGALHKTASNPVKRIAQQDDAEKAAIRHLAGARILLVEDNEMNQDLMQELLRQAGVQVTVVGDGQQALDKMARTPDFDGILMDCQMPVMDGYTATRELRKNPRFADLPIIAMTANALVGDREKVLEAGMNEHIAKPLDIREMFITLAKWITPAQSATAESVPESANGAELPLLTGIDTEAGLSTCMGNTGLYRRQLLRFQETYTDFEADFIRARSHSDPKVMLRLAHTLKGTAGNIGAYALMQAAADLERACSLVQPDTVLDRLLVKTVTQLKPVLAGLDGLAGLQVAASALSGIAATPVPLSELQAKLAQILPLLESGDLDAVAQLESCRALAQGAALAEPLQAACAALANYDFDHALRLVQQLLLPKA